MTSETKKFASSIKVDLNKIDEKKTKSFLLEVTQARSARSPDEIRKQAMEYLLSAMMTVFVGFSSLGSFVLSSSEADFASPDDVPPGIMAALHSNILSALVAFACAKGSFSDPSRYWVKFHSQDGLSWYFSIPDLMKAGHKSSLQIALATQISDLLLSDKFDSSITNFLRTGGLEILSQKKRKLAFAKGQHARTDLDPEELQALQYDINYIMTEMNKKEVREMQRSGAYRLDKSFSKFFFV